MRLKFSLRSFCATSGLILVFLALVFPRAYGFEKAGLLAITISIFLMAILNRKLKIRKIGVAYFCAAYVLINFLTALNGAFSGNNFDAIADGLRLGVVFPIVICFLWMSMRDLDYEINIDRTIRLAAMTVCLLICITVVDGLWGGQFFPVKFAEDNLLIVGIHDGYTQVISHNVGSLFFISGYILYFSFHKFSYKTIALTLFICLTVLASGRRALIIAIAISPLIFTANWILFNESRAVLRRIYYVTGFLFFFFLLLFLYIFSNHYFDVNDAINRFTGVFIDDGGARVSQAAALFEAFTKRPIFGSGFGGTIDVVRNLDRPWIFELTYMQLLFNMGLVGFGLLSILFGVQFSKIYIKSRAGVAYSVVDKSLVCGFLFLLFGAVSNPYFGSFDFLLTLGIVPFVASRQSMRRINGFK